MGCGSTCSIIDLERMGFFLILTDVPQFSLSHVKVMNGVGDLREGDDRSNGRQGGAVRVSNSNITLADTVFANCSTANGQVSDAGGSLAVIGTTSSTFDRVVIQYSSAVVAGGFHQRNK